MNTPIELVYHEKQRLQLCGLHAVNNLFQSSLFTKQDFDNFCEELTPTKFCFYNPHRSIFCTGDYDVQVLMLAIQNQNCEVKWHDNRKTYAKKELENYLQDKKMKGFIINESLKKCYFLTSEHWIAITKRIFPQNPEVTEQRECFVLLDSKSNGHTSFYLEEFVTKLNDYIYRGNHILEIFENSS